MIITQSDVRLFYGMAWIPTETRVPVLTLEFHHFLEILNRGFAHSEETDYIMF